MSAVDAEAFAEPAEAQADVTLQTDDERNYDEFFLSTPQLPSLAAIFQFTAADGDGFVLKALGAERPQAPGAKTVAGELDALAFAMGALWELAAENGENQARSRGAARSAGLHLRPGCCAAP
jgi:hypothetical protein